MAIQMRRGLRQDFDPAKMLAGEWAVSIDSDTNNQIVWMCFAPNVVKRIGTYEDLKDYIERAEQGAIDAEEFARLAEQYADNAQSSANNASAKAIEAERSATSALQSKSDVTAMRDEVSRMSDVVDSLAINAGDSAREASESSNQAMESANASKADADRAKLIADSIPDDYTTLSGKVDHMQSDSANPNKVWKTDENGVADWRDGGALIVVDDEISTTSENPVQNKVIASALGDKADKKNVSNPNLLDNPFFTVNSRGQSSYNLTTSSGYGVDRWKCAQGLVTEEILQNGIRFTATSNGAQIFQYTEPIYFENETKITLSVDTISADDTYLIFYKNKAWTSQMGTKKTGGISTLTVTIPANTTCSIGLGFYMTGVGKTIAIRSVKMEYGTVSTIANDIAPDYAEDLLRCQTSKADSADTYANKGVATGDAWQSTKSYTSGQCLIHNNVLYKVKTNCTGIEPPNATYYEPTSITSITSNLVNKEVSNANSAYESMNGVYHYLCTSSATNVPVSGWSCFIDTHVSGTYVKQIASLIGNQRLFARSSTNSGSTWNAWEEYVTDSNNIITETFTLSGATFYVDYDVLGDNFKIWVNGSITSEIAKGSWVTVHTLANANTTCKKMRNRSIGYRFGFMTMYSTAGTHTLNWYITSSGSVAYRNITTAVPKNASVQTSVVF